MLTEVRDRLAGHHKPVYTVEELAGLTGRSPYTIRRWIKQHKIEACRLDGTGARGRLLISRDQLQRLIRTGMGGRVPPTVGG
jgi:excisionase family DNA binding protein